jgi:hypothetical protein
LTLAGDTAINYSDPYQGHHFWGLDINAVMQAGGLPTSIITTEVLSVNFYANSQIILKDASKLRGAKAGILSYSPTVPAEMLVSELA